MMRDEDKRQGGGKAECVCGCVRVWVLGCVFAGARI